MSLNSLMAALQTSGAQDCSSSDRLVLDCTHVGHFESFVVHIMYMVGVESYWTTDFTTFRDILDRNDEAAGELFFQMQDYLEEMNGCNALFLHLSKVCWPMIKSRAAVIKR
jgi:hypothetical protein